MSVNVIQTSFSSGELSPTLYARVDFAKYKSGAARMRNFFVDYRSGASTRMGTKFVIQAYRPDKAVRLIPFQTSQLVSYVLEFGEFYCRPISDGSAVLEVPFNITGATQTEPVAVTVPGHDFAIGNWVFINNVSGMTQLNGRFFVVLGVPDANTITLGNLNGSLLNGSGYSPYTIGGTVGRVHNFPSPYAAFDLALIKFAQVGNLMYITHPNYPPYVLTFTGPTSWNFAPVVFGATISPPTILFATPSSPGAVNYGYVGTTVDAGGQESGPGPVPPALTTSVNIATTAGTIRITMQNVPGAVSYNFYKAEPSYSGAVPTGAAFGFIGSATDTTPSGGTSTLFDDTNIVPDFVTTPPVPNNPFVLGGNRNPGCVCFFQQRLFYAASLQFPQTFWGSKPGFYNNFDVSDPTQEDDSIEGTLVSTQVNYIRSMLPMPGGLLMFTATGVWQLSSGSQIGSTGAVTPVNAVASPQSYNGASDVPPIAVDQSILYVRPNAIVIELQYHINSNIYAGQDIGILSNHLFYNHEIFEWAWAQDPFKMVWAIRDDGLLLSLAWVKEQEIYGWSWHDTQGQFRSVATVVEGENNATYFVVKRTLQGQFTQTIERMADRVFPYGAEDAWCVDCGIQSTLVYPNGDLFVSAPSGTAEAESSIPAFFPDSAGVILRVNGGIATITEYHDPQHVTIVWTQPATEVFPISNIPHGGVPNGWSLATPSTVFGGLDYLEGQTVEILADGNVQTPQVVTNGTVTLSEPATKVTVGLKYIPQLQTMKLDMGNENDSIQGKRKKISALTVRCHETRGLSYGHTFDSLTPIKEFNQGMTLNQTIPLVSGDERVIMDPSWNVEGQICLQQDNPLPATVLGVVPEIAIGDVK